MRPQCPAATATRMLCSPHRLAVTPHALPYPPPPRPAVRSAPRGLPPLGTSPKWARTPFVLWCLASLTEQVSRVQPCCRALSGLQSLS